MEGFHFCYNHARHHMPPRVNGKRKIRVSALESSQSLQITLTHVAQAILDDEIAPAKAFALVQVLQLSYRAIDMNQRMLAPNAIEPPPSMAHLIDQPKIQPSKAEQPEADHHQDDPAQSSTSVPKKPAMTLQDFEPWRRILTHGISHPQYQEALLKYDELCSEYEQLNEADSA